MNATNFPFCGMGMFRGSVELIREDGSRLFGFAEMATRIDDPMVLSRIRKKIEIGMTKACLSNYSQIRNQDVARSLFKVPSVRIQGDKFIVNIR